MPSFTYTARAVNGELKTATVQAANREDVVAQLRRQRLTVVKVDEEAAKKKPRGGAIKMRDIVIFTRQFSTMINSGLPLVQALDILSKQTENKTLADVTRAVVFDVESGHTVADALAKHPRAFSELYVNMVAAGEAGGILDTILMRLAVFMEKTDALIRKVKGAMIYPGVIMSVAVIATAHRAVATAMTVEATAIAVAPSARPTSAAAAAGSPADLPMTTNDGIEEYYDGESCEAAGETS